MQLKSYLFWQLFIKAAHAEYDKVLEETFLNELPRRNRKNAEKCAIKVAEASFQNRLIEAAEYTQVYQETEKSLSKLYRADVCSLLMRKFASMNFKEAVQYIEDFNSRHADFQFFAFDDDAISKLANECVEHSKNLLIKEYQTLINPMKNDLQAYEIAIQKMHEYAQSMHVAPATSEDKSPEVIFAKYSDDAWWRPRLRTVIRRRREELAIECGLVNKHSPHSSKFGQAERKQQLERNQEWAEKNVITDANEIEIRMSDLIKSKDKAYQAKLTAKVRGLRDLQDEYGWHACMITLTCPSKMHPSSKKYDGTTPKEAVKHLRGVWDRSRTQKGNEGLTIYNMRVTQPHKDATPHDHFYCIGDREELMRFAEIIREQSLRVDGDEKGAQERRCDIIEEDLEKGHLSSYASRYVTRYANPDGETCATDQFTSEDTYNSAHGIRKISWSGLPPDECWDYFYKHATEEMCEGSQQALAALAAAKEGRYAAFCIAIGWAGKKSEFIDEYQYKSVKEQYTTKYGETKSRTTGIEYDGIKIEKDIKKWFIFASRKAVTAAIPVIEIVVCTVIPNYPRYQDSAYEEALKLPSPEFCTADPVPIPF